MVGARVVYRKDDIDDSVKWYECDIVKLYPDGNVRVKFVEELIPPEMDVPSESLFVEDPLNGYRGRYVNPHFRCPLCDTAWVEVQGFSRIHWDCPDCGAHKETYV